MNKQFPYFQRKGSKAWSSQAPEDREHEWLPLDFSFTPLQSKAPLHPFLYFLHFKKKMIMKIKIGS